MKCKGLFAIFSLFLLIGSIAAFPRAPLTFEERVKAQEAIERVYYNHRIWPKENPTPKPPFEEMVPREVIEAKVTDYLKKCVALDKYWQRPIRPEQLQAEMDRMSQGTKDPETLRELFAALDYDPYLVAECLARSFLADRLVRNWYANDSRFHADARRQAESARTKITLDSRSGFEGGEHQHMKFRLADRDHDGSIHHPERNPEGQFLSQKDYDVLLAHSSQGGSVLDIQESTDAFFVRRLNQEARDEITSDVITFPKRTAEAWLDTANLPPFHPVSSDEDAALTLPQVPRRACSDGWTNGILDDLPEPRKLHTAIWTGSEMIVWGGTTDSTNLATGGRYNPATDTWLSLALGPGLPEARQGHTAAWTGSEMIIWGGLDGSYLNTGGRYNPLTDTWLPTSTGSGAPSARTNHSAVWTGTELIVWGGYTTGSAQLNTGGRYNPTTDSWIPTSLAGQVPSPRSGHVAVWTGIEMIIWGGADNAGGRYNPLSDSWTATSTGENTPEGRPGATAVWTGEAMIVWGGSSYPYRNTGGRYYPATDSWLPTSLGANVPSARGAPVAVWTGSEMLIWGGVVFGSPTQTNTGAKYDPTKDSWKPISTGTNVPSERAGHTAVWTGSEMIIWGGFGSNTSFVNNGGRYNPAVNTWVPTALGSGPSNRYCHSAVWTGTEMIIWGGFDSAFYNTGGRYNLSTDSWTPTSTGANLPTKRDKHCAVWTGTEMIIWGGCYYSGGWFYLNNGGRYNPMSNAWAPMSAGSGVPTARSSHTGVWTGMEMIVWGGGDASATFNTGARYNPSDDSWISTSSGPNVPDSRWGHSAVWTGSEMIIWGGQNDSLGKVTTGGVYIPTSDSWTPTSTGANVPEGRIYHTTVWTGSEMIIWGGWTAQSNYNKTGARYNPSSDTWVSTSTGTNAPATRHSHTAVWTDSEMILWGGESTGLRVINTGGRYNPLSDSWESTSLAPGVPPPKTQHTATWTDATMIVWGGNSGGRYSLCTCTLTCSASVNPPAGVAPLSVSFAGDSTSTDCTGDISYTWRFGDGQISNSKNTAHSYSSPGSYTWIMEASSTGGSCSRSGLIVVTGQCTLTCTAIAPTHVTIGNLVGFQSSATPSNCTGSVTYSWSFGDGGTSTQQNPSHTYTSAGIYNWSMTASVDGVNCTKMGTITVTAPCSLTCSTSVSPTSGAAPLSVTFSASATASNCTGSMTYAWDFGDGQSSSTKNPTHTYAEPGAYIWAMTATVDGVDCAKTGTITVTEPCSVMCSASASPASGAAPLNVTFSGSATPSNCTGTPAFEWTFGDGVTSAQQNPTHTYAATGNYDWTMTVTVDGKTCSKAGTIVVGEPCAVTCAATVPSTGRAGDSVAFAATAEEMHCTGSPAFTWSFGDGGTSTEQAPSHVYAEAGSFTWTLTVTADDQTCTQAGIVDVIEACTVTCTATATPDHGEAPLAVVFAASATATNCSGLITFGWTFGDGGTSTEQNPSHIFAAPGTFTWTLTVAAEGNTCTQTGTVTVVPPCVLTCEASATPDHGAVPLAVSFSATVNATDCAGTPIYLWLFGDGSNSSEPNPTHIYAEPGTYPWTLNVIAGGRTCSASGSVTANPGLPGDANNDGVVSIGEVQQAINMFLGTQAPGNGVDCNGDGIVSIGEVQKVINGFLGLPSSC